MDAQKSTSHPARLIFAGNMRKVRRFREISQENLALDAGISRAYLGEIELFQLMLWEKLPML